MKFLEGFGWGCGIRILVAAFTKTDFTFRGLMVSGIVGGLILVAIKYYVVVNIF